MRARPVETLLGTACVILAAWPVSRLLIGGRWFGELLIVLALVALSGMALRQLRVPSGLTPWIQTLLVLLAALFLFVLPHADAEGVREAVRALLEEANTTVRRYTAPAPATDGLRFAIVTAIGLVAVVVDALAAGSKVPALAGIPLALIFLVAASNQTDPLPPAYFVAPAVAWLVLLWHQSQDRVRAWSRVEARPTGPTLLADRLGLGGLASAARAVGILAVVGALLLPAAIPHLSPTFLGEGLGRGNGPAQRVGFSTTVDLTRSLSSNDPTPVLTFQTSDASPPPMRVAVTSTYDNGQWSRDPFNGDVRGRDNERLPAPLGLSPSAGAVSMSAQVRDSSLEAGLVATQTPLLSADLAGTSWQLDRSTSVIVPSRAVSDYRYTYASLAPSARPTSTAEPRAGFERELALDQRAVPELRRTAAAIGLRGDPFDRAVQIQNYLRNDGAFTYSLQLAETRTGVGGVQVDPITNFLLTKQGYCVQFATAMIMLARMEGIPSRMALGFLPGVANQAGVRTVLQADAHSWPELWFPGLGWTRFEPTPASRSGAAPNYAVQAAPTAGGREVTDSESDTPTSSSQSSSTSSEAAPAPQAQRPSSIGRWVAGIGWLLLVAVVAAIFALLLPLAARRRRRTLLRTAQSPQERVETQWQLLQEDLSDYGIRPPPAASPRAAAEHYRRAALLGGSTSEALRRATATVERVRYAPPG
ncbi:transglutaminase domain-containing protein, partial [Calidifontibacter sp. DB0510]